MQSLSKNFYLSLLLISLSVLILNLHRIKFNSDISSTINKQKAFELILNASSSASSAGTGGNAGHANSSLLSLNLPNFPDKFCSNYSNNNNNVWIHYKTLHEDIITGKKKPRFLIITIHPNCGFSNRMKTINAAALFAILTQRAFIIDYSMLEKSSKKEFPDNNDYDDDDDDDDFPDFLHPNGINWNFNQFNQPFRSRFNITHLDNEFHICQWNTTTSKDCDVVLGKENIKDIDSDILKKSNTEKSIIILRNLNRNVMDNFNEQIREDNPFFNQIIPHDFNFDNFCVGCIWRFLFKAGPALQNAFCHQLESNHNNDNNTYPIYPGIGIHIRTGEFDRVKFDTSKYNITRFADCSSGISKYLLDSFYRNGQDFKNKNKFQKNFDRWFIASDKQTVIDMIYEKYPKNIYFMNGYNDTVRIHSRGGRQLGPIVDFFLLSTSGIIIGTKSSTFSQSSAEIGLLSSSEKFRFTTMFEQRIDDEVRNILPENAEDYCHDLIKHNNYVEKEDIPPFISCFDRKKNIL